MNPGSPAWEAGVLVQARRPPLSLVVGLVGVCLNIWFSGLYTIVAVFCLLIGVVVLGGAG